MGILSNLFERRSLRLDNQADAAILLDALRGGQDGPTTPDSALQIAAAWACVQVLAKGVSMLPLVLIDQVGQIRKRAKDHPLFALLHDQPNPEMTSATMRAAMMVHLLTWGNAYLQLITNRNGKLLELWPLLPSQMMVLRDTDTNELVYQYQLPEGGTRFFRQFEIMHVKGMSPDGLVGYSPVAVARRTFDRKRQLEQFETSFWKNGARPGGILKSTAAPNDKQAAAAIASWEERYKGSMNSGKTALLPAHLSYESIGLPQTDAQFLESQKFSRTEIASIFGVPSHMINDLDRATFSNIAEQGQEFVDYTLGFWLKAIEESISMSLLLPRERGRYYPKHVTQALLRGNPTERSAFYNAGLQNGYLCINDVRELEDLNPVDNGDTYFVPLNMVPLDQAVNGAPAPVAPTAAARSADVCTCGHDHGHTETRASEPDQPSTDAEKLRQDKLRISRQRLARAQMPVFEDAALRIVKRESRDVARAAQKFLTKRSAQEFTDWLRQFYGEEGEFCQAIRDVYRPLITAYAAQAEASASDELNVDDKGLTDERRAFIEEYLDGMANQHAAKSRMQMEGVLTDAQADAVDELAAVNERLDQWQTERPERIGMKYAFEALNALTIFSYRSHSVRYLRWLASGASCPFCLGLSGKIAGIDSYFVEGGATLDGGEAGSMQVSGSKRHGPLHRGCDCIVTSA